MGELTLTVDLRKSIRIQIDFYDSIQVYTVDLSVSPFSDDFASLY